MVGQEHYDTPVEINVGNRLYAVTFSANGKCLSREQGHRRGLSVLRIENKLEQWKRCVHLVSRSVQIWHWQMDRSGDSVEQCWRVHMGQRHTTKFRSSRRITTVSSESISRPIRLHRLLGAILVTLTSFSGAQAQSGSNSHSAIFAKWYLGPVRTGNGGEVCTGLYCIRGAPCRRCCVAIFCPSTPTIEL